MKRAFFGLLIAAFAFALGAPLAHGDQPFAYQLGPYPGGVIIDSTPMSGGGGGLLVKGTGALTCTAGGCPNTAVINVTKSPYNAVGDFNGTTGTDNTSAISSAITAWNAAGGGTILYFPAGVYLVNFGSLPALANMGVITGDGAAISALIDKNGATGNGFTLGAYAGTAVNAIGGGVRNNGTVIFQDLEWMGNSFFCGQASHSTPGCGSDGSGLIEVRGTNQTLQPILNRVIIQLWSRHGVLLRQAAPIIHDSFIVNNGVFGISLQSGGSGTTNAGSITQTWIGGRYGGFANTGTTETLTSVQDGSSGNFQIGLGVASILAASITSAQTTLTTTDPDNIWPPPPFYIGLFNMDLGVTFKEIMQVTAVSGATLTVTRGQLGTSPSNWSSPYSATGMPSTIGLVNSQLRFVQVSGSYLQGTSMATYGTWTQPRTGANIIVYGQSQNSQFDNVYNNRTDNTTLPLWLLSPGGTAANPQGNQFRGGLYPNAIGGPFAGLGVYQDADPGAGPNQNLAIGIGGPTVGGNAADFITWSQAWVNGAAHTPAWSEAGSVALVAGAATVTLPQAYTTAGIATCTDTTAANAVKCSTTTTTVTIAGTTTDVINWVTVGY